MDSLSANRQQPSERYQPVPAKVTAGKTRRVDVLPSQIKVLYVASAGQCAFPDCTIRGLIGSTATDDATVVTEAAHIHAYEDDGPRANVALSLKERNRYPNLITLCPTHHTIVDKQPLFYTAEMLRAWKRLTEIRVEKAIQQIMPSVSFIELELVTRDLLAITGGISTDFGQTAPVEKMEKNGLSAVSQRFLLVAIGQAKHVYQFVQKFTISDPDFAAKLRTGFTDKYSSLKSIGLDGDELFSELVIFASGGRSELKWQAAGLAVLGYFFEACEVFEK